MARTLKAYVTSAGFFDLAVAAPSMKAALEAWGAETNLFHQGFARQTHDKEVVAVTTAQPGVVLRRPVGTTTAFSINAKLPTQLGAGARARPAPPRSLPSPKPSLPVGGKLARKTALARNKDQKRREAQARREQDARDKEHERHGRAIAKAEAALEQAKRVHQAKLDEIAKAQQVLDSKKEAETARWNREVERLEDALRHARSLRV